MSPDPGWYPDPEQVQTQRYWDGKAWTDQRAPAAPSPRGMSKHNAQMVPVVGAIILVILGGLYFGGKLDHLLYPAGLNYNECGKNGFGSVYCGDELTEYEEEVVQPLNAAQRSAEEAQSKAENREEVRGILGY